MNWYSFVRLSNFCVPLSSCNLKAMLQMIVPVIVQQDYLLNANILRTDRSLLCLMTIQPVFWVLANNQWIYIWIKHSWSTKWFIHKVYGHPYHEWGIAAGIEVLLVLELGLWWGLRKKLQQTERKKTQKGGGWNLLLCLCFSLEIPLNLNFPLFVLHWQLKRGGSRLHYSTKYMLWSAFMRKG